MGGTTAYSDTFYFSSQVLYDTSSPTIIYNDDFDGPDDNGWTHDQLATQDDWQRGEPVGDGGDPDTAHTGTNVWGNDLGEGFYNGVYQPDVINYLQSPSIDCTAYSNVLIGYYRWLTVEDGLYDQASIGVNGNLVWQNPPGSGSDDFIDTEWTYHEVDITEFAAGNPDVVVRYWLQSDGSDNFGGWNVDSFYLFSYDCDVYHDPSRPTSTPTTTPTVTPTPSITNTPSPSPTPTVFIPIPVSSHTGLVFMVVALGLICMVTLLTNSKMITIIRRIHQR
jgi:bacillopeptidase F